METVLLSIGKVATGVWVALIVISFFVPKLDEDWRFSLTIGISFVAVAATHLLAMLMYRPSAGWKDGFWLTVYVVIAWASLRAARKRYALAKKKKTK